MMNKIKVQSVMVVSKHLIYGGTEKYTLNLVNSLIEKGIAVTLVTGNGPLVQHISPKAVVYVLPVRRNMRVKQHVEKRILEIAEKHKPQVIHADSRTSMVCSQLARTTLNIPLVSHEHHMYMQKDYPFIISELKEGADQIITIGPYTRKMLIKSGFDKNRIISIINGIQLSDFPVIEESERKIMREKLGFTQKDKIILCISRVVFVKGLDILVMGFKLLAKKYRNAKLLIVGDDEEHDHMRFILKNLISELKLENRVFLYPGDFNIRKYHIVADIFCYPALAKGMSVMEAMASDLPIVGKRTIKKPLVVEDMVSGLMTDATKSYKIDPGQLAEKLSYLLANPKIAKQMGKKARERIVEKYTIESHLEKVIKVYRQVIAIQQQKLQQELAVPQIFQPIV